jgi:site-specific DNA-methyltransferase (adenine-specific)
VQPLPRLFLGQVEVIAGFRAIIEKEFLHLFKSPKGQDSDASITAFEDSWHWGPQAEGEFDELLHQPNTDVAEMMKALRAFLGENDMMAYLTMMANRLLELRRVLTPAGSLYLHCDPTASHYLKIVLDGVFGKLNFRSEIAWRRSSGHNDANRYGANHDVLFFYTKSDRWTWNPQFSPYSESYIQQNYRYRDEKGVFRVSDLTANKPGGDVSYEWTTPEGKVVTPYKGRYWAYSKENMKEMHDKGLIFYRKTGMPVLKHYLADMPGVPLQSFWNDLSPIISGSPEMLGYPTQKPLALLERILTVSSNEGDVVLDPFCGCGTAVDAAQKLKRRWIGIDITHLAISLIEKRLKDRYGARCKFEVIGTPGDLDAARDLAARDKYQFQWWAVSLVEAQPFQGKKKGADTGIDGLKFFRDLDRKEVRKIVVSVKGGGLKADDVRALNHVREREKAEIALLVSLDEPTKGMIADAASAGIYTSLNGKAQGAARSAPHRCRTAR